MKLIPTILCGGAGSRLWPISRALHPKPFICLPNGNSFLQEAFLRGAQLSDVQEILTVTNRELLFKIKDDYIPIKKDLSTSFILEPFGRNTAAAVTAAALNVMQTHGKDTLLLILAADHLITNQNAFADAVSKATELAKTGKLVTFGIHADSPETGYGYIEAQENTVLRFIEKPTFEQAQNFIRSGYLWNSGMFCFSAGTLIEQMEQCSPDILSKTNACLTKSTRAVGEKFSQLDLDVQTFQQIPDLSIDYALMEKSNQVAVVPCHIGWSDIGSWTALSQLIDADDHGNRISGEVMLENVKNCFIQTSDRLIGAVGVKNLIVVDTPDALLVADQSCSQDVKNIYTQLKSLDHEAHKLHRTVFRPWGSYTILGEGKNFKIKRIEVNPGASLSLQMHYHRSEHWVVVSGTAKVTNGDNIIIINTNESTFIPVGNKHRLENPTNEPVILIEVQSGDYVGEDDIVRFEDIYGRVMGVA